MMKCSLYNKELTQNSLHPEVVAYYFKEWNEFHMQEHQHNQIEIMYVIKGKCIIKAMGAPNILEKGDFILIDANIPHTLEIDKDMTCRMLNIEFVFKEKEINYPDFRQIIRNIPVIAGLLSKNKPYYLLKDTNDIYTTLKNMIMEMDEEKCGSEFLIQQYLTEIFIKISRLIEELSPDTSTADLHVQKASRFLHQHYYQDVRVKDIADALNIHEGYLYRIFKRCTGCTPVQYLTGLRLEKAKMLLVRTEIPIIEISDYIGINSRQYFTSMFKKHTGKTPVQYRKEVHKQLYKKG